MLIMLTSLSALSFFAYGISCLCSSHMVTEFERYGLARYRGLTGSLQILAAIGLSFGIIGFTVIGLMSAAGLSIQMLLGVCVRLRIRDSLIQASPAFAYMCLNASITYMFFEKIY